MSHLLDKAGFVRQMQPSDKVLIALLTTAIVVAAIRLPHALVLGLLLFHLALLILFVLTIAIVIRWQDIGWVQYLRPLVTVSIVFSLYSSLGRLGVVAMPYTADAALSQADTWLCGFDPSLAIQPYLTPGRVELFSFVYAAFIPYIYVTIVLNCLGRPPQERSWFLTGWVFTYAISFLGYIFLPARGPAVYQAGDYRVALAGGYFYRLVQQGVEATGGMQGAFPSLHVGGSLYLCLFELKTSRLRGLIYLPLVMLIYVATVVLRYHYMVDLLAGTVIASVCLPLGRAAFNAWARRQAIGLPSASGGHRDALPPVPVAGVADAEVVLSPD
jgi:PAP2 superfamily